MIYIIIILAILFLLEGVYATLLSSRIHKLELLNMNYSSKIIELETPKIIDENKLDELATDWNDWDDNSDESQWSYTKTDLEKAFKAGYRKAMES